MLELHLHGEGVDKHLLWLWFQVELILMERWRFNSETISDILFHSILAGTFLQHMVSLIYCEEIVHTQSYFLTVQKSRWNMIWLCTFIFFFFEKYICTSERMSHFCTSALSLLKFKIFTINVRIHSWKIKKYIKKNRNTLNKNWFHNPFLLIFCLPVTLLTFGLYPVLASVLL